MLAKSAFLCKGGRSGETQAAVLSRSGKKKNKKKRKKDETNGTELQRKNEKEMQRNIGTGKDAEMIKENKTNNKIR